MERLLEVRSLTKRFGDTPVLNSLSFTVQPGHNLLIQGPSGCGKSTLLRCIAMLESFDTGNIVLEGQTISQGGRHPRPDAATRLKVGMVFQHLHLWPHMTVLHNVTLPLSLRGMRRRDAEQTAITMLRTFGLDDKRDLYPSMLSGGQQQRVALARAFVHRPHLLLLDEITSSLDAVNIAKVLAAVGSICTQGTCVVMVSHSGQTPPDTVFDTLHLGCSLPLPTN